MADPELGGAPPLLVYKFELRVLALAPGAGLSAAGNNSDTLEEDEEDGERGLENDTDNARGGGGGGAERKGKRPRAGVSRDKEAAGGSGGGVEGRGIDGMSPRWI